MRRPRNPRNPRRRTHDRHHEFPHAARACQGARRLQRGSAGRAGGGAIRARHRQHRRIARGGTPADPPGGAARGPAGARRRGACARPPACEGQAHGARTARPAARHRHVRGDRPVQRRRHRVGQRRRRRHHRLRRGVWTHGGRLRAGFLGARRHARRGRGPQDLPADGPGARDAGAGCGADRLGRRAYSGRCGSTDAIRAYFP